MDGGFIFDGLMVFLIPTGDTAADNAAAVRQIGVLPLHLFHGDKFYGYEFEGWSPEVPSTISDNMDFDAKMVDFETKIPVLLSKNATYRDLLSSIELPSNEYGRWVFTQEEGTTVGNAGTNRFDVEFIPTNEQQDKVEGIVIINVAKKEVEFKNQNQLFF